MSNTIKHETDIEKLKMLVRINSILCADSRISFSELNFEFLPYFDEKRILGLLNQEEKIFFTVACQELSDVSKLFKLLGKEQILEFEWSDLACFKFRVKNKCSQKTTMAASSPQTIRVLLGPAFDLELTDFQLYGLLKYDDLKMCFEAQETEDCLGNVLDKLVAHYNRGFMGGQLRTESEQKLLESGYIKKEAPNTKHPITEGVSICNFIFSRERILKYCTAVDSHSLDFVLTYGIQDLLCKLNEGEDSLKEYLQKCPVFKVTNAFLPAVFSVLYPGYLLPWRGVLLRLIRDCDRMEDIDNFCSQWERSARQRYRGALFQCRSTIGFMERHPDFVNKLGALYKFESKSPTSEAQIEAYARGSEENWQLEDFLLYQSLYGERMVYSTRKKLIADLHSFSQLRKKTNDLMSAPKSSHRDALNTLLTPLSTLLDLPKKKSNNSAEFSRASFADYLCSANFQNKKRLTPQALADRDSETYNKYLEINTLLEWVGSRLLLFPSLHQAIQNIAICFADAEREQLVSLLEKGYQPQTFSNGYYRLIPESHKYLVEAQKKKKAEIAQKEAEAKLKGQRETFTSMNHSIKNLVSSVTNALDAAKKENDTIKTQRMINRASQGANLIAAIANAISFSYRQSNGDWKEDLHAITDSVTMMDIVFTALFHSVPNVFAGEDFAKYRTVTKQYFVSNDELLKAESTWLKSATRDAKLKWIQDYLFKVNFDFDDAVKSLLIGDKHSTTTHFFILFNEIFWNTIKAMAYVEKERRNCHIRIALSDGFLVVDLENTANADNTSGNTGFGHIIIENYVKMFEIKDFKEYFDSNIKTYKLHFSLPIS